MSISLCIVEFCVYLEAGLVIVDQKKNAFIFDCCLFYFFGSAVDKL